MTGGLSPFSAMVDVEGVSISKVHRSFSGFSPGRFTNGKPGRSKTSASSDMALKGAMSTPTALMLRKRQAAARGRSINGILST